jgi:hypothetical protein
VHRLVDVEHDLVEHEDHRQVGQGGERQGFPASSAPVTGGHVPVLHRRLGMAGNLWDP